MKEKQTRRKPISMQFSTPLTPIMMVKKDVGQGWDRVCRNGGELDLS